MSIIISGTVYSDNGVTHVGSGVGVKLSVNGGAATSTTTNSSGVFTFAGVTVSASQTITLSTTSSQNSVAIASYNSGNPFSQNLWSGYFRLGATAGLSNVLTNANIVTATAQGGTNLTSIISSATSSLCTLAASIQMATTTGATSAKYSLSGSASVATTSNPSFTFTGSGSYTFGAASGTANLTALTLSGTCTVTLTSAVVAVQAAGGVTIGNGTTLDVSSSNYSLQSSTWSNSGTFNPRSGTLTLTYPAAGGTFTDSTSFSSITISTAGNITLGGNLTVTGNFTLGNGGFTFSDGGFAVNVAGNFGYSGGVPAAYSATGSLTLNGTNQTLSGSTTFNAFVKTTAGTLTVTDGTTQTFSNVTLQNCTITGTSTGGYTFAMPVAGSQSNSGITLSYCTATGNTGVAGAGSTDAGNNVNWTFPSVATDIFPDWLNKQTYQEYVEEQIVNT